MVLTCLLPHSTNYKTRKNERGIVRDLLQKNYLNISAEEKTFGGKKATDCGAKPHHLSSLIVAREDLMDPKTVD